MLDSPPPPLAGKDDEPADANDISDFASESRPAELCAHSTLDAINLPAATGCCGRANSGVECSLIALVLVQWFAEPTAAVSALVAAVLLPARRPYIGARQEEVVWRRSVFSSPLFCVSLCCRSPPTGVWGCRCCRHGCRVAGLLPLWAAVPCEGSPVRPRAVAAAESHLPASGWAGPYSLH